MLTTEEKAFYKENGYVVVRGLLTKAEAAEYRQECHSLADRLQAKRNIDATWGSAPKTNGAEKTSVLHCHDVQYQSAAFGRLLLNDRLTGAAADIIGPNVQLHHTKMFIKPPEKGSPFPLHQDCPFFPHEHHSMIAAIIHFDDAPLEKGCVRVVPGSYKRGLLPHIGDGGWHLPPDEYPIDSAIPIPAEAGDALFFNYLTIHGSGVNTSQEARTTILIQMRDPADPPTILTHRSRGQGLMLRGIDPNLGVEASTVPSTDTAEKCAPGMAMGGAMGGTMGGTMGRM